MDAQEFYERFKEALDAIGAGWANKESVQVSIVGDTLVLSGGSERQATQVSIRVQGFK